MVNTQQLIEADENINVVCSWCGTLQSGDPNAPLTSHTICPDCRAKMDEEISQLPVNKIHPNRTSNDRPET